MSALTDAIFQNTLGNSEGFPLGLPTSYSWYGGWNPYGVLTPPSDFSAVTGWGQIYPELGQPVVAGNIEMTGFQTWLHLTNGTWVEAQNPSMGVQGSHYPADFHGSTIPWHETVEANGNVLVDAPVSGRNDHFWPGTRGTYAPGTVDGVFTEMSMRTTDPNMHYVANLGADWWRYKSAPFLSDFSNSPGAGMSDWVELSTSWKTLYFTSWSAQKLQADPPPPLLGSSTTPTTPNVAPSVTQAAASPGTGTEHVGDTITLTLGFNEAVTVSGTPMLSLNDGNTATYVGGSGTSALTFKTTVASTDTNTSALAITGVTLPSGASIKDASGLAANLSGAVKTFSGLQISTSSTTPTPPTTGTITSFSGANGASITIDGMSAGVQNANQPWSLTEPDSNTLRFEVRPGDHFSTVGWSDLINDGGTGRSEINLSPTYAPGTPVNVSYQLTVEPGAANTADWLILDQMHATNQSQPPFAVEMDGEHMQVVLRYQAPGQTTPTYVVAWRDPNPIQRGHAYDMNVQVNFDPNGNGSLNVWRDGAQIVKYQGAIGMAGASYNWQEGIYRSHTASETLAVDYSNLHITTGSAAAALASQSFALLNQQLASNSGGLGSGQIATTASQAAGSGQQTLLTTPQH